MKRAIPLAILALVLTGCTVRFDSNTTVREDGSGSLAFEISMDEELRRLMAETGEGLVDFTGDLEDVPPGWTVTEFARDGFEGVRIGVEFASIAELDARLAELAASSGDQATPIFVETSGLTRRDGGFDFRVVLENLEDGLMDAGGGTGGSEFGFEGMDPAALFGDVFQVRYVLTLPGEVTSHNADEIAGSTLTWKLGFTDAGRVLEASSAGGGSSPGSAYLIIALGALLVIAFVVMQGVRRRRMPQDGWNQAPTDALVSAGVSGDSSMGGLDRDAT